MKELNEKELNEKEHCGPILQDAVSLFGGGEAWSGRDPDKPVPLQIRSLA